MWLNSIRWLVLIFILLFLQIAILRVFGGLSLVIPNLLLLFVVYLGFYHNSLVGIISSFVMGILLDIASGGLLGPWAAAFILTYCLVVTLSQRIFPDATVALVMIGAVCSFFSSAIYVGLSSLVAPNNQALISVDDSVSGMWTWLLVEACITGFFAPLIVAICRKVEKYNTNT